MSAKRDYRRSPLKLLVPALLALIPLLASSGGVMTTQAALPTGDQGVASQVSTQSSALVLRVYFRDTAERDRLATELAAEEAPTAGGYLTVIGDQARMDALRARGLRVEIDQAQTTAFNTPVLFGHNPDTFFGGYYTVEEAEAFMDQKVAAYPNLVEKVDIGDSWCKTHPGQCTSPIVGTGYDLWVMHITNRSIPGPKPVFWYNAGLHAREIATVEVAIRYVAYLLDNYDSNADAHWLVDHHDTWVMLMVNPDGRHIVANGASQPRSQRKNADNNDGCASWPGLGTDLNRNFPFLWNCCGGSSGSACSDTYRGTAENSEEETQAVVSKIRQLIPDQRGPGNNDPAPITATGNYVDMHASGPTNLYLWGWTSAQTPNHTDLRNIAAHMSATNAGPPGNNYQYCQSGPCFYVTDGASDDWEYGEIGAPAYTVEIGTTFYPQYTCVENPCGSSPGLWPENRGMLLYMAKIARTPYLTNRGPDANVVTTSPMTVTQGSPSQLTATINYNWTGNAYLQNVAAAEYYIDTPPWAGGTAIPMAPTDGTFNSSTEGAQATIDTSSIPVGRHIIFVRGRGVNDYSGFQSWGAVSAAWLTVTGGGTTTPVASMTATRTSTAPVATSTSPASTSTATVLSATNTPFVSSSTPTRTATSVSSSATPSRTSTPALATSTTIPCCGSMTGGVLPSCFVDATPSTSSFQGIVEINNPCPNYVPITITTQLQVSADGTNWQVWSQTAARQENIPPGPPPYAITENFPNQNIPAQYLYYRIFSTVNELTFCREYFFMSATQDICRVSTTPTGTSTVETTPTPCTITFTDVPSDSTFYSFIRCLACRGIISGYTDGTFRPGNEITRGQIAKMVSNAAGINDDPGAQIYEDVDPDNPFYTWINRLANRGHMGGYLCGSVPEEPCEPPDNRPYFRPFANATRGQLSKIVANAAGISSVPTGLFYTDVPEGHPFYDWIMYLTELGVMSGYPCGGEGEPCDDQNRPYFRPFNNVTRGQASKIVANTFFPGCVTPARP
ncbi:MAG TPA: M14 family zinc carboxypeptidase [Chloroflexia bacterium]|nr:M14 family zinc carboxypeptidase [Chloroflexia bacterium]